ncbi:MAG: beta-galactosidase [Akkermansia sp.]|nr:beta-galactosidase [Akkermansia sp.]
MKFWKAMAMTALLGSATAFGGTEAVLNLQAPEAGKAVSFGFGGENNAEFLLDGKAFQIRSGEMHPQRIPRSYWRNRIQAAKAMGLNTIAFYVFWNGLEQADGSWDFSGMNDIAAFIDLCAEEGMWVLFRPGPFVCGEWDMGGLPAYLIKDGPAELRNTRNAAYMKAQARYLDKMAEIAIPRLAEKGGNILMIQLENEYGSYCSDHDEKAYMEWLKTYWEGKGASTFYVSEGSSDGHLRFTPEGVAVGLDPAEPWTNLSPARRVANGKAPVFSSETYPGWLRHWGEGNWEPTRKTLESVKWYMETGFSFNLFVLHGGTSFGLTAGANSSGNGDRFQPDMTSYDYGSPIGEHGNLTREYFEYRDIIKSALPAEATVPEPPAVPESIEIPSFTPKMVCRMHNLRMKQSMKRYDTPPTAEFLGQNQGIIVYTLSLPAGPAATLECHASDFAQVYVGEKMLATLDRRLGQTTVEVPAREKPTFCCIVVDTFGHVNFTSFTERDCKGIIGDVLLAGRPLRGWKVKQLALDKEPRVSDRPWKAPVIGALFRAEMELKEAKDTFLDMSQWDKGYVWVNGHLLGRYWKEGPQLRLYCPADFLKAGNNKVTVLDINRVDPAPIRGCTERNTEVDKHTESLNNQW